MTAAATRASLPTRREDWIAAGLDILRAHGEEHLTIERLTKQLRRTKGAFYHHFDDIEDLRAALLGAWEASHTLTPMAGAESERTRDRRAKLYGLVGALDLRLEIAVRGWATRSEEARRTRDRIDEIRVAYLATLWSDKAARARELAEIEYATFLGLLALHEENVTAHTGPMRTLVRALKSL